MEERTRNLILAAFGQAVKERRRELGLSQEAFAEKAQLHRTYIGGIERGQRNVAFLNIIRIAQALDLTPEEFLERVSKNLPGGFPKLHGDI